MTEKYHSDEGPNQSNCSESFNAYFERAASACETGDLVLGMYLYLAAYEKAAVDPSASDAVALAALREAWHLACDLRERSMAEYVFEQLEPFLMPDEIGEYATELQNLALDRLEEFGFSREELEGMAEMISQDLIGPDGSVVKVESFAFPSAHVDRQCDCDEGADDGAKDESDEAASGDAPAAAKGRAMGLGVAAADGFNPYDMLDTSSVNTSYHGATNEGSGAFSFTRDKERAAQGQPGAKKVPSLHEQATAAAEAIAQVVQSMPSAELGREQKGQSDDSAVAKSDPKAPAAPQQPKVSQQKPAVTGPKEEVESGAPPARLTYRNLVGYDEAIAVMRDFGIGLQRDQGFQNFVAMLNARHGLSAMPALDTVLFRAPVIEDASRFLEATIGEIGLPALRMSMEENGQGMPVLCVSAQGKNRPRLNHAQNRFEGPGILVIEDLDMWLVPSVPEGVEGFGGLMMANISRGAREAVSLIRSAVEDPDVYVFATATMSGEVDPFFYEILEPMTVIEISDPTPAEREAIWAEILDHHPSMGQLNLRELTRLSERMSRYDIYLAAREALEEAYKVGLMQRMFVPVSPQNVYDKLASCHALESEEYLAIEEEMVREFRHDLEHLEDLVDGATGAWF